MGEFAAPSPEQIGRGVEAISGMLAAGGASCYYRAASVVERDFAWASRFRRLAKDYERLPAKVAGLHFVAFACPFLQQATGILGVGS